MSKDGGRLGDNSPKNGSGTDESSLPATNGWHDEYNAIASRPVDKTTPAPSTTSDTTLQAGNPPDGEVKRDGVAVQPDAPKDAKQAERVTPNATNEQFYVDPQFKNESTAKILTTLRTVPVTGSDAQFQVFSNAYKEVIARYDHDLPRTELNDSVSGIRSLQNGLEAGKLVKPNDNKVVVLTDTDLTPEDRWNYHRAIAGDLSAISDQVSIRQEYAKFLQTAGKTTESEKMSREAIELSDKVPTDLVQRQAKSVEELGKLLGESTMGQELKRYGSFLTNPNGGFDKLPLATRKESAVNSLGIKIEPMRNYFGMKTGQFSMTFGADKQFNSDRAFELASELRQKSIEITGKDPLSSGGKTGDFDDLVYSMSEQLSGRRFEGVDKVSSDDFAKISTDIFDKIDVNGDKRLDSKELKTAANDTKLTNKERQAAQTLNETQELLQGLDKTDGTLKGISSNDLLALVREQRESTERLEKIRDARANLLFNDEFSTADGNSNKYLTQAELQNFLTTKANTFSPGEMKSFEYLNENFATLSKSKSGMTRSDLVDARSNSVRHVESSLWTSYYKSRPGSDK